MTHLKDEEKIRHLFGLLDSAIVVISVRPEKFQFMEKGQNRNFGYKIVNFG